MAVSKLRAVKPTASTQRRSQILIYGRPGVGKSWVCTDFPGTYYIDTEGGVKEDRYIQKLDAAGGMYFGPEHGSTSFDEVLGQIKALASEKHDFKTVVIDSVSKLFALEIAREADRLQAENKKNEFGIDKKPAVAYMRQLVNWMSRMDMNFVLVAHQKPEWGKDKDGNRSEIGETFDAWDKLAYDLDLSMLITHEGPQRFARVMKSRLGAFPIGQRFKWSYDNFADTFGREAIEGVTVPLVLATAEQISELKGLLELVKLAPGTEEKWLAAASAEKWEDVTAEQADKTIQALTTKLRAPKADNAAKE